MIKHIFRRYWIFFVISLLFLIPGIYSLVRYQVQPSIDFTGGALLELRIPTSDGSAVNSEQLREKFEQVTTVSSVQDTSQGTWIIRSGELSNDQKVSIIEELKNDYPIVEEIRFETVGPVLGKELLFKTLIAIWLVSVVITFFLMRQFSELKYGICAVLAMFHDTLILIGAFSVLGWLKGIEVDVLFVTAVLTTLSFSVHDTIVVFDRIRELRKKHPTVRLQELASTAAVQTMARSLNNSLTIILMLLALVLLGGVTLRWFAVALLIGAITGTYSSTFTAVPLLLAWEDVKRLTVKKKKVQLEKKRR